MKNFKPFSKDKKDPDALTARSMILPIIFCLVCGVLLILFGNLALRITAYVLAGVMLLCGVWSIIVYIRSTPVRRITESRLATGLILLVAGSLLAFNPNYLEDILPFIWGLALLFGAFLKIQYAFDEKSVNVSKWWIMLIFAAVSVTIGILALTSKAEMDDQKYMFIGIMLILEAVLDVVVFFLMNRALKKLAVFSDSVLVPEDKVAPVVPAVQQEVKNAEEETPAE